MSNNPPQPPQDPPQIFVLSRATRTDARRDSDLDVRGSGPTPRIPKLDPVLVSEMQGQVNQLVKDLNVIVSKAPEQDSKFRLAEFEVSVGIVATGKGSLNLFLVANGEVGAEVNATMKLVFKRTE